MRIPNLYLNYSSKEAEIECSDIQFRRSDKTFQQKWSRVYSKNYFSSVFRIQSQKEDLFHRGKRCQRLQKIHIIDDSHFSNPLKRSFVKRLLRVRKLKLEKEECLNLEPLLHLLRIVSKALNVQHLELHFKRFFVLIPDFVNYLQRFFSKMSRITHLKLSFERMPEISFQIFEGLFFDKKRLLNQQLSHFSLNYMEALQMKKDIKNNSSECLFTFLNKIHPICLDIVLRSNNISFLFLESFIESIQHSSRLKRCHIDISDISSLLDYSYCGRILESLSTNTELEALSINFTPALKNSSDNQFLWFEQIKKFLKNHHYLKLLDVPFSFPENANIIPVIQSLNWLSYLEDIKYSLYLETDLSIVTHSIDITSLRSLTVLNYLMKSDLELIFSSLEKLIRLESFSYVISKGNPFQMTSNNFEFISNALTRLPSLRIIHLLSSCSKPYVVTKAELTSINNVLSKCKSLTTLNIKLKTDREAIFDEENTVLSIEILHTIAKKLSTIRLIEIENILFFSNDSAGYLEKMKRMVCYYGCTIKV
jgi:hypothetical protein